MELPNIGNHCSILECKQLDFLPLRCQKCLIFFCSSHFKSEQHECTSLSNFTENPEYSEPIFKCPVTDCQERGTIGSECPNCLEKYCLKHRTSKSHFCDERPLMVKRQGEESIVLSKKLEVKEKLLEKVKLSGDASKNSKTQQKLKFSGGNGLPPSIIKMMAKKKAKGDSTIPMAKRLYLEVAFPVSLSLESQCLFFDDSWALGKAIDSLALISKIPLTCGTKDSPKRIIFYNVTNGQPIPTPFNTFSKVSKELDWNHNEPSSPIPKLIAEYGAIEGPEPIDPSQYFLSK